VPVGVAVADAGNGAQVTCYGLGGPPLELIASAAVSAGTTVEPSTTAGQVKPFTTGVIGVALDTFAGSPLRGRVVVTPIAVSLGGEHAASER
jgi:hypothetical protein